MSGLPLFFSSAAVIPIFYIYYTIKQAAVQLRTCAACVPVNAKLVPIMHFFLLGFHVAFQPLSDILVYLRPVCLVNQLMPVIFIQL